MGVDQGEKQGELPTAGVHDGDGLGSVGGGFVTVNPPAEIIILTQQSAGFALHAQSLVCIFGNDVMVEIVGVLYRVLHFLEMILIRLADVARDFLFRFTIGRKPFCRNALSHFHIHLTAHQHAGALGHHV